MFLLLLFACPGGGLAPGECRSSDDCTGALECSGPDDFRGCGMGPRETCASDDDCGTGLRCRPVYDACSADGIGAECDVPCDAATCGDGFSCVDGACRAISCADDATLCAGWQVCDPTSVTDAMPVYDQHHGCVTVACEDDAGCAEGLTCVNGFCQEGPGTCEEVELVP